MTHEQIISSLKSLAPAAEWTLSGDDYSALNWLGEGNPPTFQEIESEHNRLLAQAEVDKVNRLAAKEAAEAKLAALGLTSEDLKALGL